MKLEHNLGAGRYPLDSPLIKFRLVHSRREPRQKYANVFFASTISAIAAATTRDLTSIVMDGCIFLRAHQETVAVHNGFALPLLTELLHFFLRHLWRRRLSCLWWRLNKGDDVMHYGT